MGIDPEELIDEVEQEQQNRGELAKEALQWFLDEEHIGEFYPRDDVAEDLANELDVSTSRANVAISDTVGDIVDPVQQITTRNTKYVGVMEYRVYSDEGAYGYVDFDDKKQERKRVVCAKCVEEAEYDEEVVHATQGEGTSNQEATWDQLLNKITGHYAESHTEGPSEIEPGASLVNGTTISGNTAVHAGNEGDLVSRRDVARNAQGQVQFKELKAGSVTATGTETTKVTGSGIVVFDKVNIGKNITTHSGYVRRNGGSIQSSGQLPVTTSSAIATTSPVWTLGLTATARPTLTVYTDTENANTKLTSTQTKRRTYTFNNSGSELNVEFQGVLGLSGTGKIIVDTNTLTSIYSTDVFTITTSTQTTLNNPEVNFYLHLANEGNFSSVGRFDYKKATLLGGPVSVSYTISQNDTYTL